MFYLKQVLPQNEKKSKLTASYHTNVIEFCTLPVPEVLQHWGMVITWMHDQSGVHNCYYLYVEDTDLCVKTVVLYKL